MTVPTVILKTFDNYLEAEILKGRLAEEGIITAIKDEHTVTMNWMWSNAIGGIKLLVSENDLEKAKAIIKELENEFASMQDTPAYDESLDLQLDPNNRICVNCGSKNTKLQTINKTWAYSTMLFLGFPIKIKDDTWHCFHCGANF